MAAVSAESVYFFSLSARMARVETALCFANKLRAGDAAGYDVRVMYVTAPTELALRRSIQRANKTGRWLQVPWVYNAHSLVSQRFAEIVELDFVDDLRVIDNTDEPKTIARASGGKLTVEDSGLFNAFLDKGGVKIIKGAILNPGGE